MIFPKKRVAYECYALNLDLSVVPLYHCFPNDRYNCSSLNSLSVVAHHTDTCSNFVSKAHFIPNALNTPPKNTF